VKNTIGMIAPGIRTQKKIGQENVHVRWSENISLSKTIIFIAMKRRWTKAFMGWFLKACQVGQDSGNPEDAVRRLEGIFEFSRLILTHRAGF